MSNEDNDQIPEFLQGLKALMLKHGIKSIEPADHDGISVGIVIDEDHGHNYTIFAWSEADIRPEKL